VPFPLLESAAVKTLAVAALVLAFALPASAQAPEPAEPPAEAPAHPKPPVRDRFFFGGGIGATFGTVDYVEVAPLIGVRVVPRFDVGFQPFYRWTNDSRYSPQVSTTDYGARLFGRVIIVKNFFAEVDYQYTNYEYANGFGGTTRAANNAFLAGGGYSVPIGHNAGMYFSALYDFSYDDNNVYYPYDSPVQLQFGFSVGF
jgi:hypothetical protein